MDTFAAPIHREKEIRIICIGAGASGLLLAYKIQRSFENFTLTLYDKNNEVGGVWLENVYPGCTCDVPSHNYTWSFEPKVDFSAVYPPTEECFDYFHDFAVRHDLKKYCKFNHQAIESKWNKEKGGWDVKLQDLETQEIVRDFCHIFVNSTGALNCWKWPDIPGLKDFAGPLLHTAAWDKSVDIKGKHVGLIGNGASGIQLLPAIQPIVKKVTSFVRSPAWVSPAAGLEDHIYTEEERDDFLKKPGALLKYRKQNERQLHGLFYILDRTSAVSVNTQERMTEIMKAKLNNPYLEESLIPKWALGCRRLTPGPGYLEALGAENVDVAYGEILKITPQGCVGEDGKELEVDILVCATGFDTTFRPRFPILGPSGDNLQDLWAEEPRSYMGVCVADFPNYFTFLGPNSPNGNGAVLCAIEAQADYMLRWIDRYQSTHNMHSFAPTTEAVDDFVAHKDAFMPRTAWAGACRSWYKRSPDDKVIAMWPGSSLHYLEALEDLRAEDFNVKYSGNRFAWLGNGYSQTEKDEKADWAYYVRETDDSPLLGRKRRRMAKTRTADGEVDGGLVNLY